MYSLWSMILLSTFMVPLAMGNPVKGHCLFTRKDKPCEAKGRLPLSFSCAYPGRFLQVSSVAIEYMPSLLTESVAAVRVARENCKASRRKDQNGGYSCTVSDLCPYADLARYVRVKYFCWELDPDLLAGFQTEGKKESGWM